ncbi:MAG: sensor histidine kinase [Halanaerobiales bacterium]
MFMIFIHNMALIITSLYLVSLLKKYMLKNEYIYPKLYMFFVSTLGGLLSSLILADAVVYNGARYDLRSVPIFLIAYINGWKFGLLTALLPAAYRIYLGGPTVIEGIVFDIIIALIIGSIGHQKSSSDRVIVNIDGRKALLLYFCVIALTYSIPLLWIPISLSFWIKLISLFTLFSLITIYFSIYLINDFNKDIYRNLIEFSETKEVLLEREKELERQNLNIRFFSNISHEFKTPLNLIFSALQMLDKYNKKKLKIEDERFKRYLCIIKQNGYRLLRLVDNVIDITRIDVNSFRLNLINVDIVATVKDFVLSIEEYVESKERKFEFISNVDNKVIAVDPENLERVILNLISNAVKFTETGDSISVNLIAKEESVDIVISDTGIGIDEDKQKHIFELFRQADESFSRRAEGSGIGLYIVKQIIDLHDGEVWVESEKGKGSSFYLRFPVKTISRDSNDDLSHSNELIDKIDIEFSDIYNV